MLYFGYCTLLDADGMRKYCPTARFEGVAWLPDSTLSFGAYSKGSPLGGCTLERAPGKVLFGALYEVVPEELADLDRASGIDHGWYRREPVVVTTASGGKSSAVTYVLVEAGWPFAPSEQYVAPIVRGARALRLPEEYIEELGAIIHSYQNPSPAAASDKG